MNPVFNPEKPNLSYVQVNPVNLDHVIQIQKTIWPQNPVDRDYLLKAERHDDPTNVSWLVYRREASDPDTLIGLTGVYTYDPDETGHDDGESIWMDWFGLLPAYRGHGYGEQILLDTIHYAAGLRRFKYFRLDTSDFSGRISTKLYDKVMPLRESYTAEVYPEGHRGLIYSCSLAEHPIKPWSNRRLDLNLYGALERAVL